MTLLMLIGLACNGDTADTASCTEDCDSAAPDDTDEPTDDTGEATGPCADPTVTFVRDDGVIEDYTTELTDGTYITLKFPGELQICPATWFARVVIEDDVRVVGLGDTRADTVLSGGEQGTVLDVTDGSVVSVENLTLDRGLATDIKHNSGGGGLYCENFSEVYVENVTFSNGAGNDAGGLYAYECDVEVVDAEFYGNVVEDDGGAVSLWLSNSSFRDVTFRDNLALDGGAMAMFSSTVTITDALFDDNTSTNFAGGIWVYQSSLTMSDSIISDSSNPSGLSGGGLIVYGDATLSNVTFTDNTGPVGGGVFVEVDSDITAASCTFSGNDPDDVYIADYSKEGGVAYSGVAGTFSCESADCTGL